MLIDDLLRIAVDRKASDLHLKVGNYPCLRVDGELVPLSEQPRISAEDMLNMAFSMMSNRQKQRFKEAAELDLAYGVAGLGRFRVNVFQQRGNVGCVLRVIPTKIRLMAAQPSYTWSGAANIGIKLQGRIASGGTSDTAPVWQDIQKLGPIPTSTTPDFTWQEWQVNASAAYQDFALVIEDVGSPTVTDDSRLAYTREVEFFGMKFQ
jgi:hypothetical protein